MALDMTGDGSSILFASANRSVRHPSYTDLYYRVGGAQGSRDLKSEWADHIEAGVRLSLGKDGVYGIQFEQALFHRQGHDLIDWARPNGNDTTFAINLREVTFTGLETVVNVAPNQPLSGDWQVRYARLGFTTMEASETSAGFESNYVLDGFKTKVDASVGFTVPGDLPWTFASATKTASADTSSSETGQEVEYEPFSLVSLTASRRLPTPSGPTSAWTTRWTTITSTSATWQPGRWVRLGFAYQMK